MAVETEPPSARCGVSNQSEMLSSGDRTTLPSPGGEHYSTSPGTPPESMAVAGQSKMGSTKLPANQATTAAWRNCKAGFPTEPEARLTYYATQGEA